MKIVFSYVNSPTKRYMDLNMAKISLKLIKNHGYKTVIYLDEKNYDRFNELNYDEKILLDQKKLDNLPPNIWCLGKLLVFSQMEEPFLHIDFDLFAKENSFKSFLNEPLVCFHEEKWVDIINVLHRVGYNDIISQFPNFKELLNEKEIKSYNCAVVGGVAVKEIRESAQIVLNYAAKNKQFLYDKMNSLLNIGNDWMLPIVMEQILFTNICKNKLNSISCIIDEQRTNPKQLLLNLMGQEGLDFVYEEMIRKKIIHLWGSKKKLMNNIKLIK
jgi:hypothetical protein